MTPHQRAVADRFLAEMRQEREPIVVSLSGAHAYGFPRAAKEPLDDATFASARPRMNAAFARLDAAHASAVLPEEPAAVDALEAWLVKERLARC